MEAVGLDSEMIGIGSRSYLAQVSIVDFEGKPIYNEYVKPPAGIDYNAVNYRTRFSGITKNILKREGRN